MTTTLSETPPSGTLAEPAAEPGYGSLTWALKTGIPYAAGEAARRMISDWSLANGLDLLASWNDRKFPDTNWRGDPSGDSYVSWLGCNGSALAQIPEAWAIVDCDDGDNCQIAHLDLPPHLIIRGWGGHKHFFRHPGGLRRVLSALGRPVDFLGNPSGGKLWVRMWAPGYEVLSWYPEPAVLPACLLEMHAAAVAHAEEFRANLGSVPLEQYLREGIPPGQQSNELWRSACSLAARGCSKQETQRLLREIADRCELTRGPWRDDQLASMARRAVIQFGRPDFGTAPAHTFRHHRERMAEKAAADSAAAAGEVPGGVKARLAEVFGRSGRAQDVSAGQASVCAIEEGDLSSHKQHADLQECDEPWSPCVPLDTPADLKAKWVAERDDHALSRDWDHRGGEQSRNAYGWVMQQLIAGVEVHREQIEDQIWECLSRKSPNGAILLSQGEDGQVIAWSDPETDPLVEDLEDRDPWPSYPGCPEGRNPKAGPYVGRELGEQAVKAAWAAQKGKRATGRVLTEWINTHRAELGMESPGDPLGCRYMHLANVRRITRELYDRGELKKTEDEEHYRRWPTWRTLPAAYVPAANPVPTLAYQMRQAFGEEPRSSRRTVRRHRHRGRPKPSLGA